MTKNKSLNFQCNNCGEKFLKWQGQCPACAQWDSLVNLQKKPSEVKHITLDNFSDNDLVKFETTIGEFDRVIGGGYINGSSILISGEPGIGKSTLILQIADKLSQKGKKILYVSGEESLNQIALRAKRLNITCDNLIFISENDIDKVLQVCRIKKPDVIILDSVQTVFSPSIDSSTGSVSQVRKISEDMSLYTRINNTVLFLIGQVTKTGDLAGPRSLEHLVDVVLSVEGDRTQNFRILRSFKNRYGSTDEIGVFQMCEDGLKEVKDASEILLERNIKSLPPGIVRGTALQGNRMFIVEVEALTVKSRYSVPARVANGFNSRRLSMLIAVLDKWGEMDLSNTDIYCNIAGDIQISDTSLDLPVCLSIYTSFLSKKLPVQFLAIAEVGLSGELRNVKNMGLRIKEARRLGYDKILLPSSSTSDKYYHVDNISKALDISNRITL